MSPGNKYQPYTAADILRYLQGEMTGKEMHQLEMDALDDPFLQDLKLSWQCLGSLGPGFSLQVPRDALSHAHASGAFPLQSLLQGRYESKGILIDR